MNTQPKPSNLKRWSFGLVLAALPTIAAPVAGQQWTPTSNTNSDAVSVVIGDTSATPATAAKAAHTVSVSQDGLLVGRVAAINTDSKAATGLEGLQVFFVRNGQVVKQARTANDGSFAIENIQQGPYSFYAAGKSGIAAYGVYVTQQQNADSQNILIATPASAGYYGLQQLLRNNVPQQVSQSVAQAVQASEGFEIDNPMQIRLINGKLYGQISSLFGNAQNVAGTQVHLIQNDRPIAQVQTDGEGNFSVPDLQPGVYDFVAANQTGFTAGRFEAIGTGTNSPMTQVSFRKLPTLLAACLTAPTQTVTDGIEYAVGQEAMLEPSFNQPIEYASESIAYGGASGGSCGCSGNYSSFGGGGIVRGRFGGGGFGGASAGGMGRLLMLGGLGGSIVAIADDDDPQEISPSGSQ